MTDSTKTTASLTSRLTTSSPRSLKTRSRHACSIDFFHHVFHNWFVLPPFFWSWLIYCNPGAWKIKRKIYIKDVSQSYRHNKIYNNHYLLMYVYEKNKKSIEMCWIISQIFYHFLHPSGRGGGGWLVNILLRTVTYISNSYNYIHIYK